MRVLLLLLCCILLSWFAHGEESSGVGDEGQKREIQTLRFSEEENTEEPDTFMPEIKRVKASDLQVDPEAGEIMDGIYDEAGLLHERFVLIHSFAPRFEPAEPSSSTIRASSSQQQTESSSTLSKRSEPQPAATTQQDTLPLTNTERGGDTKNSNDSNHNNNRESNEDPLASSINSVKFEEPADVSSLINRLKKQLTTSNVNDNQAIASSTTLRSLKHEDYEDGDF